MGRGDWEFDIQQSRTYHGLRVQGFGSPPYAFRDAYEWGLPMTAALRVRDRGPEIA